MRLRRRGATWFTVAVLAMTIFGVVSSERAAGPTGSDRGVPDGSDTVVRVLDGDTVVLRSAGKSRLIGVDTPEVYGRPECFGREASAFTKQLLQPGDRVRYRLGREPRDRYQRLLIYLWPDDGRFINELLVSGGYAVPLTIPPNDDYAGRFNSLAARAQRTHRGLWSRSTCDSNPDAPSAPDVTWRPKTSS